MRTAPLAIVCALGTPMSMAAQTGPLPADAAELRRAGLDHGYNLDYAEALASFGAAIAADPQDAAAHRLTAATLWMQLLFEQGAVTVEGYMGQARATVARRPPTPALAAAFHDHLHRAISVAERALRERPNDPDAHFQAGAAAGLRASYVATVEGRVKDSIGAGRRAYAEQKRVLSLDPSRADAGLIVGCRTEHLCLAHRNSRVAFDQFCHHAAHGFEAQAQRGHPSWPGRRRRPRPG